MCKYRWCALNQKTQQKGLEHICRSVSRWNACTGRYVGKRPAEDLRLAYEYVLTNAGIVGTAS